MFPIINTMYKCTLCVNIYLTLSEKGAAMYRQVQCTLKGYLEVFLLTSDEI